MWSVEFRARSRRLAIDADLRRITPREFCRSVKGTTELHVPNRERMKFALMWANRDRCQPRGRENGRGGTVLGE